MEDIKIEIFDMIFSSECTILDTVELPWVVKDLHRRVEGLGFRLGAVINNGANRV